MCESRINSEYRKPTAVHLKRQLSLLGFLLGRCGEQQTTDSLLARAGGAVAKVAAAGHESRLPAWKWRHPCRYLCLPGSTRVTLAWRVS